MPTRRDMLRTIARFLAGLTAVAGTGWARVVFAAREIKKRILPEGTDPQTLLNQNPKYLDTRHLKIMPLAAFDTMGDTTAPFNRDSWRLEVTGAVAVPLNIAYDDLLLFPVLEREVLLVCPGVFAVHGRWKGFSVKELMKRALPEKTAAKVICRGYSRFGDRQELFSLEDVHSDRVFLAYAVNDTLLPVKHGYPLRVVAEGHWGSQWVKYVQGVEFR